MNYSRAPQITSEYLDHLKNIYHLNGSNSNTFVLIQESKNDLKIYSSFLAEVFTLTRNHELFLEHFGFIENVFIEPI